MSIRSLGYLRIEATVFPPGEAREDWRILRALSGALDRPLPFDSLHELRRRQLAVLDLKIA